MIRADVRFGHTLRPEPAQTFEEQTLPESFALIIGMRAHRLKMTDAGQLIRPDDAAGRDSAIGCHYKDLMSLHTHRRLHQAPGAGPILFKWLFRTKRRV